MNFSKPKFHGGGGKASKEKTREELLADIKAERAERGEARKRNAAASTIQRFWRGHYTRSHTRARLALECIERLAATQAPLSAREVAGFLLPRLLFLLLPDGLKTSPDVHHQILLPPPATPAAPATHAAAAAAAAPAAGGCPVSLSLGPESRRCSHKSTAYSVKLIRVGLSALIQSLSAPSAANNYMALAGRGHDAPSTLQLPQQQQQQQVQLPVWWWQCGRLQRLCCMLVGRGDDSGVVDAAAIRVLALLTDAAQSKLALDEGLKASIAARLLRQLVQEHHAVLFEALGRVLAKRAAGSAKQGATTGNNTSRFHTEQANPQMAGPALQRLLNLALAALEQAGLVGCADSQQQQTPHTRGQQRGEAIQQLTHSRTTPLQIGGVFVRMVLVAPGAAEQLPADVQARLREPHVLSQLCSSFQTIVPSLLGVEAAWGLANLTLLVAGEYGTLPLGDSARVARVLRSHSIFPHPALALAYARTACALLGRCLQAPEAHALLQLLLPCAESGMLAAARGSKHAGAVAGGRACQGLTGGSEVKGVAGVAVAAACPAQGAAQSEALGMPFLAHAMCSLWPLAQRPFLLQLLTQLLAVDNGSRDSEECGCGLVMFGGLYAGALQLMPAAAKQLAAQGQGGLAAEMPSLLSALAFAPGILPSMWKWLASNVGLPVEAPKAATRGLDVVALWPGYAGLAAGHALVFGLFCKLYNHLLMVLDDSEFYEDGPKIIASPKASTGPGANNGNLILSQARAVVTSLNSLVFHTHLPRTPPQQHTSSQGITQKQQQQLESRLVATAVAACGGDAAALLAESAPLLLRSLYERDARRSFCQPLVWLAPYKEMFGDSQGSAPAPAPAPQDALEGQAGTDAGAVRVGGYPASVVLQSLMQHTGGARDSDEEEDTGPRPLQSKVRSGVRPAAVAALLRTAPQCVPFARRVDLFRALIAADMRKHGFNRPMYEGGVPPIKVTIRRGSNMMNDAYSALAGLGPALRARVVVTFINEQGLSEAGLDYGGLMKEFLEEVVVCGFNADYGLFTTTPDGLLYPRPSADKLGSGLQLLEFLGSMVGKALYEGMLINVQFAPFFISRLQGRVPIFEDLRTLDPELHRSLLMVKYYDGDVSDLGLTFSTADDFFGLTTQHALLPGHANTPVTNENRLLYCHLLADWHLNVRLGRPAEAFARGLTQLIPAATLRLFNPKEFNQLVSGATEDGGEGVDIHDLRRYTRYGGGYRADSTAVELFWKVMSEFSSAERGLLLKFVTSCSRAPLGGFKYLHPPFTIHKVECEASMFAILPGTKDVDRLPSASTCYNTLKLPNYRRKDTLHKKLLHAITSNAGFDLS